MTTIATAASYPGLSRNAVVAASAGTGKTQLLTTIYMAHVLGLTPNGRQVPAERIVATTFSRAAAAEIRERLEERLGHLSDLTRQAQELDPRVLATANELGIGDVEIARRAAIALAELPQATIDTLHGLASRILRAHAFEFGVSPDFSILDEEQAEDDGQRVIDDALARALGKSAEVADAAARLVDACGGLERTRLFIRLLLERLDEEGIDASELAPTLDKQASDEMLAELQVLCRRLGASDLPEIAANSRSILEALRECPPKSELLTTGFLGLVSAIKSKRHEAAGLVRAFLEGVSRKSSGRMDERALSFIELALSGERLEADAEVIRSLLREIREALLTQRLGRGLLGFGDLLRIVRDGLRDDPMLASDAQRCIELLLVDEFQDTSRVQRDLLLLLRERPDSVKRRKPGALPQAADIAERGLIVVGDRKQSIYAFRGADVSVFTRLAAELAGRDAAEQLALKGVNVSERTVADFFTLTDSYRSRPAIVHAVNLISEHDFDARAERSFEISYAAAEALRMPEARLAGTPGRMTFLSDSGEVPENAPPVVLTAKPALRAALLAAGYVAQLSREGTPLSDIAILARRRATLPLVELALDRLSIPYVVSGRALYATPEVRDLFAALRLSLDPGDRHALSVVARGLIGGLSDVALSELCVPRRGLPRPEQWDPTRVSDADERALVARLRERLCEYLETACRLSPRDALELAVGHFELERLFAELPRGKVRFGNVERLLEIAARHGGNLAAFVRWLERQISVDADEAEAAVFSEEDEAVRLLTIHGSKGLAFPTVVLLDANVAERPMPFPLAVLRGDDIPPTLVIRHRGDTGTLTTPLVRRYQEDALLRSRAERQRLSYVALTRAKNELAIVLPDKPYSATLAETIDRLLKEEAFAEIEGVRTVSAVDVLSAAELFAADEKQPESPPKAPLAPSLSRATIGVTALADFAACPRRFTLLHVEGIREPELARKVRSVTDAPEVATELVDDDDPRALGSAAHAVLERWPLETWGTATSEEQVIELLVREGLAPDSKTTRATALGIANFLSGEFAQSLRAPGTRVYREFAVSLPLVAKIRVPEAPPKKARQLELFAPRPSVATSLKADGAPVLKATFDLVVERPDGSIDIVDYKRTRMSDGERYEFQLAAYRALAHMYFGALSIRTGLVHLLGESAEPNWQTPPDYDLHELVTLLVTARYSNVWSPVPRKSCLKLHCGFVSACHPKSER